MPMTFQAKTGEAYQLKVLAELLTTNLKTGCFEISEGGIQLRQMDSHRRTLIDLSLPSLNFCLYRFKGHKKRNLGLNLNHFHRMLKTIKKKDSIEIYIEDEAPNDLVLKAIPKEKSRETTSYVKIQNIQQIETDVPEGYGKPVIVQSAEFTKTMKDMLSIGTTIRVSAKNFQICFHCEAGCGIFKRSVVFGEPFIPEEEDEDEEETPEYCQEFATEQLVRITKIAGLCTTMKIFPAPGLPLLFHSRVGSIGDIKIYVKSKEEIEDESNEPLEDSDPDE